jgi:hypothetical protein
MKIKSKKDDQLFLKLPEYHETVCDIIQFGRRLCDCNYEHCQIILLGSFQA